MLKLQIIIGSMRPKRAGEQVAHWIYSQLKDNPEFETELIDLKEINLPILDEPEDASSGRYVHEHTKKWSAKISQADVYIWVTPEYNHGIPASLKNAIDFLYYEWNNKPLGLVSYGNVGGGLRSAEQLKMVAVELEMATVRPQVSIPLVWEAFDEAGQLKNEEIHLKKLTQMTDYLIRWGKTFKRLREDMAATKP